ncbi:MAG: TonB-dependent receptor, partial [Odoribacter sp.]|nr:TonB-dependent receptor [Odoribacter sp.]
EPQAPDVNLDRKGWGTSGVQTYYTHEASLFLDGNFHLTSRWRIGVGLRYALSFQTGPFDDLTYDSQGTLIDSVHYGHGCLPGWRQSWEPRFSVRYSIGEDKQIQASYNRQQQWINLVSISGVGLPTDFWVPASKNIPSQRSDNFSVGYFQTFSDNRFEFSVEGYYRKLYRQMEYKSALFDLFNQQYILERSIHYGSGEAYGMEMILKKNRGQWSGWASYTLGWSKRTFPAIMNGAEFPAKHDRRHDLSLVGNYKRSEKWDFSAVFVYATGSCYTMPTGMYMMGGNLVKEYGAYNGSRLPAYHRLDLSVNYWFFKTGSRESGLNFSVYNVYKRSNPLYIFVVAKPSKHSADQIIIRTKRKRLYDILPSVSWTFKF